MSLKIESNRQSWVINPTYVEVSRKSNTFRLGTKIKIVERKNVKERKNLIRTKKEESEEMKMKKSETSCRWRCIVALSEGERRSPLQASNQTEQFMIGAPRTAARAVTTNFH